MQKLLLAAAGALFTTACQPAPTPPAPVGFESLVVVPRTMQEIAADIRDKKTTSAVVTQAFLDRIAAVDDAGPMLNAVLAINPDALAEAKALADRGFAALKAHEGATRRTAAVLLA